MNNTGPWFTAVAAILAILVGSQLLANADMLADPQPVQALMLLALGIWLAGYGVFSARQGQFDLLGPILRFSRFRHPVLFTVVLTIQLLVSIAVVCGGVRLLLSVSG